MIIEFINLVSRINIRILRNIVFNPFTCFAENKWNIVYCFSVNWNRWYHLPEKAITFLTCGTKNNLYRERKCCSNLVSDFSSSMWVSGRARAWGKSSFIGTQRNEVIECGLSVRLAASINVITADLEVASFVDTARVTEDL